MLIRNPRIWLAIWIIVVSIVVYGGFTDGWTPLRIIVALTLVTSGILRGLGWYFTDGIFERLQRMNEEQRTIYLARLKPHDRESLLRRLDQHRQSPQP